MTIVGVTGHRFLADPARIEAALDEVVAGLETRFPEPWAVMSGLAEGADRVVSRRLLEHPGTRLEPLLAPGDGTRDQDYEALGAQVAARCEVLVALWDGEPAQGRGGTAWVVEQARRRGVPIVWVHVGNRRPGTEEPTSLGDQQGAVSWEGFDPAP